MKRDSDDMDESAHVSHAGARLALRWRDQAFRLAFRRAGGILPRIPGIPFYRDGITTAPSEFVWAPPAVQAASLRIINGRRVGVKLHPNVRIVDIGRRCTDHAPELR